MAQKQVAGRAQLPRAISSRARRAFALSDLCDLGICSKALSCGLAWLRFVWKVQGSEHLIYGPLMLLHSPKSSLLLIVLAQ